MVKQFLGKLHRPRNIRDPPVQLAIDEVSASSEEQSERRRYDEIVAEVQPRDFVPPRVVSLKQQQSQHPAVTRHPAFPNAQDRQRLAQHFRLVEENVAETPANDHAKQRATGDEIAYALRRQIGITALG